MDIIEKAKEFAVRAHDGQVRKGAAQEPYTVHLEEVARLAAGFGAGEAVIAAAWLHDTVEDCDVSAGDLRAIVSSIQIVADVERMGALALHVAKIARRRHPQHVLPEEVNGYFAEMGRVAVEMADSAREVLLSRDPDKARRIREEDDAMDDLHRHLFSVMMDREWKHGVAAAVDVTLLGRFYERFADHAVEISRRVIFHVTGQLPAEEEIATY